MGFNNEGAARAAGRLSRLQAAAGPQADWVVGVNIGKTKVVSEDDAVADYVASAHAVARQAGYLVVNVSSPNTPGLRSLQAVEKLGPLLAAVRRALDEAQPARRVPLLVKIAPDLADEDVDQVADLALRLALDGIIATNTTTLRAGLQSDPEAVAACGAGGLSGRPLKARALQVLTRLRARVGDRLVLISAGGIETADDVRQRLQAGASLVQIYSAFVYDGPLLPSRLNRGLLAHGEDAASTALPDAKLR